MEMGTTKSGAVHEREDGFLKRLLATWPPELPTHFAGLSCFLRGPGDPWRRALGRLCRDTPFVAGWSHIATSSEPPGNTSGACAPFILAQFEPEVAKQVDKPRC